MLKKNPYQQQAKLLKEKATVQRLRAVKTELAVCLTLCATAETEIRAGQRGVARKLVQKLRHHAKVISFHLDEPGHFPKTAIPDLRKRLTVIEKRIGQIDAYVRRDAS